MSLFIGNISSRVRLEDLELMFEQYGNCKCKILSMYAFVDYEKESQAEEAISHLQAKLIGGRPINIEWSLKSGRYKSEREKENLKNKKFDKNYRYENSRDIKPDNKKPINIRLLGCFGCGSTSHKIKECDKAIQNNNNLNKPFKIFYPQQNSYKKKRISRSRHKSYSSSSSSRSISRSRRKINKNSHSKKRKKRRSPSVSSSSSRSRSLSNKSSYSNSRSMSKSKSRSRSRTKLKEKSKIKYRKCSKSKSNSTAGKTDDK